jgi:glutamine synthetase adenylyltransferase
MIVYGSQDESEKKYPASLTVLAKEVLSLVFNNLDEYPDKIQLLKNLEYLISGRVDIESFLRLMLNEKYLKIILHICGYSNSFTRIISEQEKLLELIYNFGLNELPPDIHNLLRHEDQKNISLIQSINSNLSGKLKDSDFYLKISEFTDSALKNVINEIVSPEFNKIKYAVFALGKLGSREMGINSDADLFFVYDALSEQESKPAIDFFEKLVQTLNSKSGAFFELDLRLRPEGKNAPLAIDRSSFFEYLKNRASFWEKLALTRVRPVCGDSSLIIDILKEIRIFVYTKLTKSDLDEVIEMRKSIEKKSFKLDKNSIDLKVMEGGLVDIEFLVQVIKILFRSKYPSLEKKNTPGVLLFLKNKGMFPVNNIMCLIDSYYYLRNIEKYIALNNLSERYILRKNDDRNIYKLIGFSSSEELFDTTKKKMKNVRQVYIQMFKKFERFL